MNVIVNLHCTHFDAQKDKDSTHLMILVSIFPVEVNRQKLPFSYRILHVDYINHDLNKFNISGKKTATEQHMDNPEEPLGFLCLDFQKSLTLTSYI